MARILLTPTKTDDISIRAVIDDKGAQFLVLVAQDDRHDAVGITMTPSLFKSLARYMTETAEKLDDVAFWTNVQR